MLVIEPTPIRPVPKEGWLERYGLWCIIVIASVVSLAYYWSQLRAAPELTLQAIANQTALEGQPITLQLVPEWKHPPGVAVEFGIITGPPSATIDPQRGRWQWTPDESTGGRKFRVKLAVRGAEQRTPQATREFTVTVREAVQPPHVDPIEDQFTEVGETLSVMVHARDPDVPAQKLRYQPGPKFPAGAVIDADSGRFTWSPEAAAAGTIVPVQAVVIKPAKPMPVSSLIEFVIAVGSQLPNSTSQEPPIIESVQSGPPLQVRPAVKSGSATNATLAADDARLIDEFAKLYRAGQLCDPASYPALRSLVAARFARAHAAELTTAFQGSGADLQRWLGAHPDLRDELYTAFDGNDDVPAAMKIVERLLNRSFQRLTSDFELAIATAITWDRESGVYDYTVQQRRSHATVSRERTCDAIDNFDYYSSSEFVGRRRIQKLPWEFLQHVVNHRTPLEERTWVQRTYHDPRRPIGQCYEDVAYDHQMIKSGETTSQLAPRAYTLANLKDRGGICVMQADYATRVAKCLGIPAAYVEGRARSGGNHAWVMWTELQSSTSTGLAFSLESHGRFFLDRYYVGQLLEPQSGRLITDRELELRLQGVGLNPLAYRQAKLIMQAWPELKSRLQLTVEQELEVLESVIELSPGHQAVWQAVAQLAKSGRVTPELNPRLDGLRDRCIKTLTNCPDFICQIIDELLAYEPDLSRRLPTYDKLLQLWASTGRPDLTCRLRLQLSQQLVAGQQYQAALGGLAQTIKRFPDEGRYVPQLLDKYEALAVHVEDGQSKVLKLYQELLPLIPRRRQSQTSPFYLEMLARAARRFAQAGETKPAQAYADQLKKLQGK